MVTIAETDFVIEGPRKRVWNCLTKALLRALPLEQMNFLSERSFSALLVMKMSRISFPMQVNLEITQLEEPECMISKIRAEGMKGLIRFQQKTSFTLNVVGQEQTQIIGKMEAEKMSLAMKIFLIRKIKRFARQSLQEVENLLRQWV